MKEYRCELCDYPHVVYDLYGMTICEQCRDEVIIGFVNRGIAPAFDHPWARELYKDSEKNSRHDDQWIASRRLKTIYIIGRDGVLLESRKMPSR